MSSAAEQIEKLDKEIEELLDKVEKKRKLKKTLQKDAKKQKISHDNNRGEEDRTPAAVKMEHVESKDSEDQVEDKKPVAVKTEEHVESEEDEEQDEDDRKPAAVKTEHVKSDEETTRRDKTSQNRKPSVQSEHHGETKEEETDLDAWAGRLEEELIEVWKMKERAVTIVILDQKEFDRSKNEQTLEGWDPSLAIRGDSDLVECNASGCCGPGACFGGRTCEGASKFLLKAEGTYSSPPSKEGSLYISRWDIYNPDVYLGDLWHKFDEMINMAEKRALPGPWTESRLTRVLERISKVIHTSPPDNEAEFLWGQDTLVINEIDVWIKRVGKVLKTWSGDSQSKTLTISIARKGWDTTELVCPSIIISTDEPSGITYVGDWEGDYRKSLTTYKEAAEELLEEEDDWRSHKYYGMHAWAGDFFGEERLEIWNQYEEIGLLEGPWTQGYGS